MTRHHTDPIRSRRPRLARRLTLAWCALWALVAIGAVLRAAPWVILANVAAYAALAGWQRYRRIVGPGEPVDGSSGGTPPGPARGAVHTPGWPPFADIRSHGAGDLAATQAWRDDPGIRPGEDPDALHHPLRVWPSWHEPTFAELDQRDDPRPWPRRPRS